jgi:hypothetical protein
MVLKETTTNVVTARGESSSGRSTQDTDEATVVVTQPVQLPVAAVVTNVPRLPSTGVAPRERSPIATTLVSFGILGVLMLIVLRKRQSN